MSPMKQRSQGVFIVAVLFLAILVAQVFLYGNFFRDLKTDTGVINDLSRIRGSIQRYTKLEIAGFSGDSAILAEYIDGLIARNMENDTEATRESISQLYDMKMLNMKWRELKTLITEYHDDPSKASLTAVVSKSEECWETADATVVRQQYVLNKTAAYSKYFTMTFGINLSVIILILLLYKRFVLSSLTVSATNDALTGIFNKGYFDKYLEYEIARSVRKQTPFSLIMFDIDHFKNVNDTYGHRRGDYALKTLADVVIKCKRNADVLARIGGEEFIILLPDTKSADAILLATRVRKSVEDFPFEEIGRMTISLGITQFAETDNKETLLKRVDSALYLAKQNGRNRCELIERDEKEKGEEK